MAEKTIQNEKAIIDEILRQKELAVSSHPLAKYAGMFKDDPLLNEWKESMAAYRRKVDKDAEAC
jgi:hypothetical protein